MAHVPRFFVPAGEFQDTSILLPEDELHHALHVLRLKPGDEVIVFNGRGTECAGHVNHVDKRSLRISIDKSRTVDPPVNRITLMLARLGREKAMTTAIQRAVELGVDRFVIFQAEHSEGRSQKAPRWDRPVIESCKQCERLWLPEFELAGGMPGALKHATGALLLATAARPGNDILDAVGAASEATVIIGPEGGLASEEEALAVDAGALPISLGPYILRTEVAVAAAATLVRYALERARTQEP